MLLRFVPKLKQVRLCLVGLSLALLSSASVSAMTLSEVLVLTNQNNPTLRSARLGVQVTNESVRQAIAAGLPTVSATVSNSLSYNDSVSTTSFSNFKITNRSSTRAENYNATLNFSQILFAGGGLSSAVQQADATVRAAWYGLASQEQQQLLAAATAYLQIYKASIAIELSDATVALRQEQLRAAQARREAGVATITDLAQAQSAFAQAIANRSVAEQNEATAKSQLFALMGQNIGQVFDPGLPSNLPANVDEALQRATGQAPALMQAKLLAKAAERNVRTQKAALLPSVTATGSAGRKWDTSDRGQDWTKTNSYSIGANVSIPIFSGGDTLSKVRQANHEHSQTIANVQAAHLELQSQVLSGWTRFSSQDAVNRANAALVDAAQAAAEATRAQAEQGQASTLDVIQIEQQLTEALIAQVSGQADYILAAYNLLGAMGELSPSRVGGGIAYSPVADYKRVISGGVLHSLNRSQVPSTMEEWQALPGKAVDFFAF